MKVKGGRFGDFEKEVIAVGGKKYMFFALYSCFMRFFFDNFSTSGSILNRFSETPSGYAYASEEM